MNRARSILTAVLRAPGRVYPVLLLEHIASPDDLRALVQRIGKNEGVQVTDRVETLDVLGSDAHAAVVLTEDGVPGSPPGALTERRNIQWIWAGQGSAVMLPEWLRKEARVRGLTVSFSGGGEEGFGLGASLDTVLDRPGRVANPLIVVAPEGLREALLAEVEIRARMMGVEPVELRKGCFGPEVWGDREAPQSRSVVGVEVSGSEMDSGGLQVLARAADQAASVHAQMVIVTDGKGTDRIRKAPEWKGLLRRGSLARPRYRKVAERTGTWPPDAEILAGRLFPEGRRSVLVSGEVGEGEALQTIQYLAGLGRDGTAVLYGKHTLTRVLLQDGNIVHVECLSAGLDAAEALGRIGGEFRSVSEGMVAIAEDRLMETLFSEGLRFLFASGLREVPSEEAVRLDPDVTSVRIAQAVDEWLAESRSLPNADEHVRKCRAAGVGRLRGLRHPDVLNGADSGGEPASEEEVTLALARDGFWDAALDRVPNPELARGELAFVIAWIATEEGRSLDAETLFHRASEETGSWFAEAAKTNRILLQVRGGRKKARAALSELGSGPWADEVAGPITEIALRAGDRHTAIRYLPKIASPGLRKAIGALVEE